MRKFLSVFIGFICLINSVDSYSQSVTRVIGLPQSGSTLLVFDTTTYTVKNSIGDTGAAHISKLTQLTTLNLSKHIYLYRLQ